MSLRRVTAQTLELPNRFGIPVRVLANEQLKIEPSAVEELESVLEIEETAGLMKAGCVEAMALTPDFHKGAGIPIGTVMRTRGFVCPQAPGSDVNCGMRLLATGLTEERVAPRLDGLAKRLRYLFFEGGRQIPMTRAQRRALLTAGLPGLVETHCAARGEGLWRLFHARGQERDLARVNGHGQMRTDGVFGLEGYLGRDESLRYDDQIGSVGGGNHFVELQVVERVCKPARAREWGLRRGEVVVMVHSGSLMVGHLTGGHFRDLTRRIYPKNRREPANKLFVLPAQEGAAEWRDFWMSFSNAANFAFGNRLFLGMMAHAALLGEVEDHELKLVYDTGHNMIWPEPDGVFLHRKGACPARAGEPVLIPGSMGAPSYVLEGRGSPLAMESASHGAGRSMSRGEALKASEAELQEFLRRFRVVTPIDPSRADLRGRRHILRKWEEEIKKEAPWAYKDVGAVVETQTAAGVAEVVAELRPLMTVKG